MLRYFGIERRAKRSAKVVVQSVLKTPIHPSRARGLLRDNAPNKYQALKSG
jgi:hypothetical protein